MSAVDPPSSGGNEAEAGGRGELRALADDSRTIAAWTLVSRITGFARVAVVAAVLGPTYFGNLFQTASLVPNILHELLTGSLITAMLVPSLVRCIDQGDRAATRRLANGFVGVAVGIFSAVIGLALLAIHLILQLITLAVGDPEVRAQQQELGALLLPILMPQLLFYGIAAVAVAVQHAHRRFALAAAAPALENLGIVLVMGASAALFGIGPDVREVGTDHVLFLGVGCTAAVALHAAVQWWGAARAGVTLVPRFGWRDPEIRRILRLAVPSSGYAALNGGTVLGLIVVAGGVPGGAIAFQIGFHFYNLPLALGARPLAAAQLPRLASHVNRQLLHAFHRTYRSSLALVLFAAVPAGLCFLALAPTLARAVSFGEMASPDGVLLVAAAIGGLGAGVIGESAFLVSTSASYARGDAGSPFRAMTLRAVVALLGMVLTLVLLDGQSVLFGLGAGFSTATLVAALYLHRRQVKALPALPPTSLADRLGDGALAIVALLPAVVVAASLGHRDAAALADVGAAVAALLTAATVYLGLQWLRGSENVGTLTATVVRRRPAADAPGSAALQPGAEAGR